MQKLLTDTLCDTLSADKPCREAAEHALNTLTHQQNDFIVHLIQFAGQELPGWPSACDRRHASILLAAAIRVRNMLCRANWNRTDTYPDAVKKAVKQSIVSVLCEPHVSEAIRRQLLSAVADLIGYDYPSEWSYLIPQVNGVVDRCVQDLLHAEQRQGSQGVCLSVAGHAEAILTSSSSMPVGMSSSIMTTLLRLKGALSVLRRCCKVHENAQHVDIGVTNAFADAFVPSLCSLTDLLLRWWKCQSEAASWLRADYVMHAGIANLPQRWEDLLELPCPVLVELSHGIRLTLKCLWSLMFHRLPRCLCDLDGFCHFWNTCVTTVGAVMQSGVMPWCRARLMVSLTRPDADYGEHASCFDRSSVWRMFKWSTSIVLKMAQNMITPKSCEKGARAVATHFCAHLLQPAVADALSLVRWHSEPIPVTSKAYILSLELLCASVDRKDVYTHILLPAAEELMTALLFARLGFTKDDTELWESNPEEYVRRQTSPAGDLYSAKVVSCNLLLSFAVPSRKYHNTHLLESFARFVIGQLEACSPAVAAAAQSSASDQTHWCNGSHEIPVSQPGHTRADGNSSNNNAHAAARCVDAALYALYQFSKAFTLLPANSGIDMEAVLLRYVVPATHYAVGFLRARAVLVLATYSRIVHWSCPSHFHTLLHAVLTCLHDAELPVQIQTCMSFAALVRHRYARAVVAPGIAELVGHYFRVMRVMDNEAVVRTLRKTTELYHDTLVQWSCELTDMIVQHFDTTLGNVTDKLRAVEEQTPGAGRDRACNADEGTGGAGARCDNDAWEDAKHGSGGESASAADEALSSALLAADELLQTLITLVKAIPCSSLLATVTPATSSSSFLVVEGVAEADLETHIANDTFVKIQNRVGGILYSILSYSSGTSYGFMDATLQLVALLISRSPVITPALWRLLPCLYELIVHGGASDYFAQMLPTLDNMASVAPVSFWCMTVQQLCGDNPTAPASLFAPKCGPMDGEGCARSELSGLALVRAVGDWTPAQVVHAMCATVLHNTSLRELEVAAVPKMVDAMMLQGWAAAATMVTDAPASAGATASEARNIRNTDGVVVSTPASVPLECRLDQILLSAAARLEKRRLLASSPSHTPRVRELLTSVLLPSLTVSATQHMLTIASTATPPASPLLRILLANSIFSCLLADAESTLHTLAASHALRPFFAHYMQGALRPRMMALLRPYDRGLFVLALAAILQCLHHKQKWTPHAATASHDSIDSSHMEASHTALWGVGGEVDAALCLSAPSALSVERSLLPQLLCGYAEADVAARRKAVERLERLNGRESVVGNASKDHDGSTAAAADALPVDSEDDEEEWESDEENATDEEDEEEEEEWDTDDHDGEGLRGREDGMLQALVHQAQKLRDRHHRDPAPHGNKDQDSNNSHDDDGEEEWDTDLLDDECVVSPIDTVNAWEVFSHAVQSHIQHVGITASHATSLRVVQLFLQGDAADGTDGGCATAVSQAAAMTARLSMLRDAGSAVAPK